MRRRGFLGGLAAGAAAIPSAASEAVLKVAGVGAASPIGAGSMAIGMLSDADPYEGKSGGQPWFVKDLAKLKALKAVMPDWFKDKYREDSQNIQYLDLDVASFVSVSPAAKITIQRDRQFKRRLDHEEAYLTRMMKEHMFKV